MSEDRWAEVDQYISGQFSNSDDALESVADATSEDAAVQAVRRFYAAVAGELRVTATAIQTVGVKGYDGFAVILVTA